MHECTKMARARSFMMAAPRDQIWMDRTRRYCGICHTNRCRLESLFTKVDEPRQRTFKMVVIWFRGRETICAPHAFTQQHTQTQHFFSVVFFYFKCKMLVEWRVYWSGYQCTVARTQRIWKKIHFVFSLSLCVTVNFLQFLQLEKIEMAQNSHRNLYELSQIEWWAMRCDVWRRDMSTRSQHHSATIITQNKHSIFHRKEIRRFWENDGFAYTNAWMLWLGLYVGFGVQIGF